MDGGNRGVVPGFGVSLIGVALLLGSSIHVLFFHLPALRGQTNVALLAFGCLELAFLVLPPGALVYAGLRIADGGSGAPGSQRLRLVWWCSAGAVTIPAIIGAIKFHQYLSAATIDPTLAQMELLTGAGTGGVMGLLIGLENERAWRQSERVREQQDAFDFLDKALRHHVLNSLNVVIGYARIGRERLPEGERDVLDPVVNRSESIVALVDNVGRIAETYTGELAGEPLDVVSILAEEVEASRRAFDYAEFDAALPDRPIHVRGNEALRVAFENVLRNAVEHNDRQRPAVRVSVNSDDSTVTVRFADDGPGIPASERDRIFEPRETGASGFGLYLVKEIVEYHRGSLSIRDNDPRGTVITVTLPLAVTDPP